MSVAPSIAIPMCQRGNTVSAFAIVSARKPARLGSTAWTRFRTGPSQGDTGTSAEYSS